MKKFLFWLANIVVILFILDYVYYSTDDQMRNRVIYHDSMESFTGDFLELSPGCGYEVQWPFIYKEDKLQAVILYSDRTDIVCYSFLDDSRGICIYYKYSVF